MSLLLQVDRRLSVKTFVLSLHVGETCEVIGVDEGQINLKNANAMSVKKEITLRNTNTGVNSHLAVLDSFN